MFICRPDSKPRLYPFPIDREYTSISDHDIVVSDFLTKPHYIVQKPRKCYVFGKASWESIKEGLSDTTKSIEELYNEGIAVEPIWNVFKAELFKLLDAHIPSKTFKQRHSLPWMNRKLKKLVRRKHRLHRQARKTNQWNNYRSFQKECKREFRRAEWDFTNKTIEEGLAQNNSKPFWRYIKSKKQENIGVSPLKDGGKLYSDSQSKADILLKQFSSVFTRSTSSVMPPTTHRVPQGISNITVTIEGTEKLLKNINVTKAVGPDNIPNRVLRECAHELAPIITLLFQRSLDTGCLPSDWTAANVSPIFKKGDRHLPENYRPVSLTCVLSKLLEHIVCRHMLCHLENNNVLTSLNHGFRSGYSCETQLAITIDHLSRNYDKNLQTDIIILDFSKAFDTVPHDKLLHKLENYGIRGPLLTWIRSFLCSRLMSVVVEGETSQEATVDSGVPQGTVLGPLLFLCHINDLPECVSSQVRLFADDCLLYRPIRSLQDQITLQQDLSHLETWASNWGMRFNAKKCYVLSIKNRSSYFYKLNNHILQSVPKNPYLGLMISNDLKWTTHISNICSKASSTLGFLRRNLRHCSTSCRKNAYISLVRSTLEYGAVIWDPYTKADIDKLERIQRRAARFISHDYKSRNPGSITRMLADLDLDTLQERRKELRLTFLFKVVEGLVPAIPAAEYLEPVHQKRRIRATKLSDYISDNTVKSHQLNNSRCFKHIRASTDIYKHSFFPRTISEWNELDDSVVNVDKVGAFRSALHHRD